MRVIRKVAKVPPLYRYKPLHFRVAYRLRIYPLITVSYGREMYRRDKQTIIIEEPPIARLLFADTRMAWLWLPLRLYLGWAWWEAGWHKFVDPKWMDTGEALLSY